MSNPETTEFAQAYSAPFVPYELSLSNPVCKIGAAELIGDLQVALQDPTLFDPIAASLQAGDRLYLASYANADARKHGIKTSLAEILVLQVHDRLIRRVDFRPLRVDDIPGKIVE